MQKSHTRLVLTPLSALPPGTGLFRAQAAPSAQINNHNFQQVRFLGRT
jgi:hypothetical protein